jgi:hypothetical protein
VKRYVRMLRREVQPPRRQTSVTLTIKAVDMPTGQTVVITPGDTLRLELRGVVATGTEIKVLGMPVEITAHLF